MRRSNQKNRSTSPDSTFDTLEARKLLTVVREGNKLIVTGTSGDDLIVVTTTTTKVNVEMNDEHHSFNSYQVAAVEVHALAGNDTIRNSPKFKSLSTLYGGGGDDLIYGGKGKELIYTDDEEGDDTVYAGPGDDTIYSILGNDYIDGGSHSGSGDTISIGNGTQGVTIDLGGKPSYAGTNTFTLKNIEHAYGTEYDDHITGNSRYNLLVGYGGNDVIYGRGGNDTFSISGGATTVHGGSGDDDFVVSGAGSGYEGSHHVLYGEGGADQMRGGDDSDRSTLYGGSGSDYFHEDNGSSIFGREVFGQAGDDEFHWNLDADEPTPYSRIIDGGSGGDLLYVRTSDEVISARITLDLIANDGRRNTSDTCNVRYFERLVGYLGDDLFDASLAPRGVYLEGSGGNDTLIGSNYADTLSGSGQVYYSEGNGGDDLLDGNGGNDKLIGGFGIDTLLGGPDNDTISAADGLADIIDGGDGTDEADIDEGLDQTVGVEILT